MKIKKTFSVVLSVLMVFICLPVYSGAETIAEPEYVEGEILIISQKEVEDSDGRFFTASVDDDTVMLDFDNAGIESIEDIENYTDEENLYIAEIDGDVEKICKELNKNDDIIAEPNYILHTCDFTMPTEVSLSTQTYAKYEKNYFEGIIHVPESWQAHEVTGNGVTIAIIDNGFNTSHPDLDTNKLWKNSKGTYGWNTYDNSDDISPIYRKTLVTDEEDSNYNTYNFPNTAHGSNVAGIIGMMPNGIGGIGAAYGATLMLLQAANYNSDNQMPSFTASALSTAVDFATENGADIINMSLTSASPMTTVERAIKRAYNAGILVIAAAGNDSQPTSNQLSYPASYPEVLGVMAIDNSADTPIQLSDFSNYDTNGGQYYDIAAPGVRIFGFNVTSNYTLNSGTSQAAPLVAGVAALYMEKYPENTIQQLKNDMLNSANDYVTAYDSTLYKYKSLNALKFLNYCEPPEIYVNEYTNAILDNTCLYGLDEGFTDISDYFSVVDGTGSTVFTPTANGCGTGSKIDIYNKHNELYKTVYVIIFGDLNGDTFADGQDAVLAECINSGFGTFTAEQTYAADVTFDGNVGTDDIDIIMNYAVGNDYIFQTK